ncbi:MAG: LptF/LptG family permease [Planctomycetes bacterium]|nr:LptF/LptG family permease [Planctomycetota bacterium]
MWLILHRYIFHDLLKVFVLSATALTSFLALAYALSGLRDRGLGPLDSLQLVLCFIPAMLIFAMPIAALLTTTLVYGKLASENEITACRASGISMHTLLWPVVVFGLLIGAVNFALFDRIIPWSWYKAEQIGTQNIERIFFHLMRTKKEADYDNNFYIHAKHVEGNMLYGVVINYYQSDGELYRAYAPAAHISFSPPQQGGREAIQVTARQPSIADDVKAYARERANKILLAFPKVERVMMILDSEDDRCIAECIAGVRFAGSVSGRQVRDDMPAAIAAVTDEVIGQLAGPPPAGGDGQGAARKPYRSEEVAAECWDAEVVDHGQIRMQLFDIHGSDPGEAKLILGDYSFVRSINKPKELRPREMTLAQLRRRYDQPQECFAYRKGVAQYAGPEALAKVVKRLKAESLAEEHSRYASIVSCVLLVGLGAALGTIFRHGHILTAFSVSMGPGLFAIFAILVGKQMIVKQPESMHALVWVVWTGNIVLLAINAVLIPKLLRR